MEDTSLLKIISEKLVKPSSPTQPSSRYYKLSALDACLGHWIIPLALFYPDGRFHGGYSSRRELFELLETSLSKTLTYYYPFAGRFMDDNITIDCNDAGVQLWHVEIKSSMSKIVNNRVDYQPWNSMVLHEKYHSVISQVRIQLNYFECGGICIAVLFSHKLGDGTTLANFINDWAVIARGSQNVRLLVPILSGSSIFPPPPSGPINTTPVEKNSNLVTQRFVFSTLSISELKRKVITETEIKNPTQVEVVTALIFERLNLFCSSVKASLLMQIIDFRPITIPPLSKQMVGNFVDKFMVTVTEEKEMTFLKIVTELRKSKMQYLNTHGACLEGNEFTNRLAKFSIEDEKKWKDHNFDLYTFSSWFRLSFYEADFGFGKPIFVCPLGGVSERIIILMANPNGDGIDAFVTLKQNHMSLFEKDQELLAFASLNPIICTLK